ncbi:MAG: D-alanyl-D-alanine carboxypeptidase [Paraglaciecola sp.]
MPLKSRKTYARVAKNEKETIMTRKLNLSSLFTLLFFVTISFTPDLLAQTNNPKDSKLDAYLSNLSNNEKMMTAVYVSQHGETLYEYYSGFASVEDNIPLSAETEFRLGSMTKIFTSILTMQLIEEDKLSLETKLSTFYPDIPNAESITVKQLLSHRTGIQSFTDEPAYVNYMTKSQSRKQMEQRIQSYDPLFKPNSKHQYSNSNYVLLGFIIESLYEKSYAEVVSQKITVPLGLANTYFGSSIEIENNEAFSYHFLDTWQRQPETHISVTHAAGGMVSTAKETNLFLSALFAGKLLSENSLSAMMTLEDGYGLGLFSMPFHGQTFFGHNGSIDGFVSAGGYNPADGMVVTVLSNGVNYNFNDVLIAVLSSNYGIDFKIPDLSAKPVLLSAEEMGRTVGTFSSKDMPIELSFRIADKQVMYKPAGQSEKSLTPYSETEFRFEPAGIVIQFDPQSLTDGKLNQFVITQSGYTFLYKRKEEKWLW